SMQDLEDRLKKRAQDDDKTISRRLTFAKNEIKHCIDFDYFIINQDFDVSVRELLSIIDSEKNKISNLNYSDVLTKLLN
ncbi:MAG: guanylate kinase, partial [Pseudomonadota bacterium]|nr:guanylate kinase [Pseudomonadota bacterium]